MVGDIEVSATAYSLNGIRSNVSKKKRDLSEYGKPIPDEDWYFDPSKANAYYIVYHNEIV
jgi:predicted metalloendopeptidase